MKPFVGSLQSGQKVWAVIEEMLDSSEVIINFHGDLLRIKNVSNRNFRTGQRIQLHVVKISPLEFKLVETKRFVKKSILERRA